MTRQDQTQYEQDRLGNERRKLDTLRAQEGKVTSDSGLTEIQSADTGSVQILHSAPSHSDQVILDQIRGFNSVGSGNNTMTMYGIQIDSNGNITSSERRSVPLVVGSGSTATYEYDGEPFQNSIGVSSEFQGWIGVGVYSDHEEQSEDLTR